MTNRAAATVHRRLDDAQAEALARDGGELAGRQGALIPPSLRRIDMRTMTDRPQKPKVLLLQLSERTSARGTRYFSGWLGKASVVAFPGEEPDKFGNPTLNVYVSTPEPRPEQRPQSPDPGDAPADRAARPVGRGDGWRGSQYRRPQDTPQRAPAGDGGPFYDDGLEDIGR